MVWRMGEKNRGGLYVCVRSHARMIPACVRVSVETMEDTGHPGTEVTGCYELLSNTGAGN